MRLTLLLVGLLPLLSLTACSTKLSPVQERAWDAFYECKKQAPTAVLEQIAENGGIRYTAREGDVGIMQRCLQEKFGYKFN